jgi:hypothetical protein
MNNLSITIDIKQLSEEIHLAVKTIRSTLVNNPTALPPRLIICGQKKLLWLREDVIKYYSTQKKITWIKSRICIATRRDFCKK